MLMGVTTTSIRIDRETHRRLVELSRASESSLLDTVREAAEALWRQRFARQVAAEYQELRQDPAAWESYLAELDSLPLADGLD